MPRVLIAGGSLGGLMAASLLARSGHEVVVLERTAGAMDFLVRLSGPAETDWPSPVRIATYCLPSTA